MLFFDPILVERSQKDKEVHSPPGVEDGVVNFLFTVHFLTFADLGRPVAAWISEHTFLNVSEDVGAKVFGFWPLRLLFGTFSMLYTLFGSRAFYHCTPDGYDAQGAARGYISTLLLSGWQIIKLSKWNWSRSILEKRLISMVQDAEKKFDVQYVGLGALTAYIARDGYLLTRHKDIKSTITTGNPITGVSIADILKEALDTFEMGAISGKKIAVVGASGATGSLMVQTLAKHNPDELFITAHTKGGRLDRLRNQVEAHGYDGNKVTKGFVTEMPKVARLVGYFSKKLSFRMMSVEMQSTWKKLQDMDIIILVTTAPGSILEANMIGQGRKVLVLDVARPRNVNKSIIRTARNQGKDVHHADGGSIEASNVNIVFDIGVGKGGRQYACQADTTGRALFGLKEHAIGKNLDIEKAEKLWTIMKASGFHPSPLCSFGESINVSKRRSSNEGIATAEVRTISDS